MTTCIICQADFQTIEDAKQHSIDAHGSFKLHETNEYMSGEFKP